MRCLTLAEAYGHVTSKHFCLSNSSGDNNVAYSSLMEIRRKGIEPIVILIVERMSALFCFVQQNPDTNQVIFFANNEILKIHCRRGNSWKRTDQGEQGIVNKLDFRSFLLSIYFFINFSLISQSGKTFIFTNYLVKR